ncbi:MAG: GNAT family N-acetyltransferase [Candidatus Cloacimonetes bacterium]|nr:GNAT family N-acetyltransferase [Candidatus Cloacimonadota bacterium]
MNSFELISDYKLNDSLRNSFNELASQTFGIDFEKWYQAGFWNENYICYSYMVDNRIISNVSVNKLQWIIDGKSYRALQIGTVMTLTEYRKQGLASRLMRFVLDTYRNWFDIIYLFPEDDAHEFYKNFGFVLTHDSTFEFALAPQESPTTHRQLKLSHPQDRELFLNLMKKRTIRSNEFDVTGSEHILTWFCVNLLSDCIYYLPDFQVIVLYKINGSEMHIYDIIADKPYSLGDVCNALATRSTEKVVLYFTPESSDMLIAHPNESMFILTNNTPIPSIFAHPFTAHA